MTSLSLVRLLKDPTSRYSRVAAWRVSFSRECAGRTTQTVRRMWGLVPGALGWAWEWRSSLLPTLHWPDLRPAAPQLRGAVKCE